MRRFAAAESPSGCVEEKPAPVWVRAPLLAKIYLKILNFRAKIFQISKFPKEKTQKMMPDKTGRSAPKSRKYAGEPIGEVCVKITEEHRIRRI